MFGYIIVNKPELKVRELEVYQGYYCGLCKSLKERYGNIKRLTLNNDLTFVALLLSSLDLDDSQVTTEACLLHPTQKKKIYRDCYVDYCADMTILFSYYKCQDDWKDDHKKSMWMYQKLLKNSYQKVIQTYPEKCKKIVEALGKLDSLENEQCHNIDELSNCFGEVMAEIICYKNEEWHHDLRKIGFSLGKFIYLMDAYDDLDEDEKKHEFNVLLDKRNDEHFEEWIYEILSTLMAEVLNSYENLPIVENDGILKNIICSGIWSKYQSKKQKEGVKSGSL